MKNSVKIITGLMFALIVTTSCHKLDVPPRSALSPEYFPNTPAQFNSVMGPIYTRLRSDFAISYWQLQCHATDESVQPAYGGNWFDGGRFMQLYYHTWDTDNPLIGGIWNYFSDMIGISNQIIFTLNTAPDGAAKRQSIAEMKIMRAYSYFNLMDLFGNVPIDTVFGAKEQSTNVSRAQVFNFVESELKNAIPNLSTQGAATMYGKPNRYEAYALLAKVYLNAQVYTGTAKWNEAIAACHTVMNAGGGSLYVLENRATYLNMVYPLNGPAK